MQWCRCNWITKYFIINPLIDKLANMPQANYGISFIALLDQSSRNFGQELHWRDHDMQVKVLLCGRIGHR